MQIAKCRCLDRPPLDTHDALNRLTQEAFQSLELTVAMSNTRCMEYSATTYRLLGVLKYKFIPAEER